MAKSDSKPAPKITITSPCSYPGSTDHEPLEFECLHRPHGVMFNDITLPSTGHGTSTPVRIRICKHCKVLYAEF